MSGQRRPCPLAEPGWSSPTCGRSLTHYLGQMIRHTVMFRWAPTWTEDQRAAVEAALGELPAVVPTIRSYHFGSDIGVNEGNFDFVVVADFDDVEGFLTYRDHPQHQRVIAELIAPHIETRHAVQFELRD